jgi:hypothetical protein
MSFFNIFLGDQEHQPTAMAQRAEGMKNRREWGQTQAESKKETENPNWDFQDMITQYRKNIEFCPQTLWRTIR